MGALFRDAVAVVLWGGLGFSAALAARGLIRNSWHHLVWSAVPSLLFSGLAAFSIGWLTLLLPCLQLAAALALRLRARWWGWGALLGAAVLLWRALVRAIW